MGRVTTHGGQKRSAFLGLLLHIKAFDGKRLSCLSREPGEWALERAKLNVNENFLLVGILEELEDVLLLLERFLPHYFKGVLSIYKDPGKSMWKPSFLWGPLQGFLALTTTWEMKV